MINKPNERRMQSIQMAFHNLLEVVELYPHLSISNHLAGILRRRSETGPAVYDWTDEELASRIEKYKDELENDSLEID